MSFIIKQMLNNINTDIEALQLEDINIGLGGEALGESIASIQDEVNQLILKIVHYGFRATSTHGLQNMYANNTCYFNTINTSIGCYCVPNINAFETANYRYIIPIDGYYVLGYKLYINGSPAANVSFGIFVNNALKIQSGQTAGMGETMQFNIYCNQGESVLIKCATGNGSVEMQPPISQFYGYRIGF